MQSILTLRNVADQAYAEHASGAVSDQHDLGWLAGVEEGLRWAVGDGTTREITELLDRMAPAGR